MRDASGRRQGVLTALALSLCLAACGGGAGGGDGDGGPGDNNAPTASLLVPALGVAGLLGDTFVVSFTADDDDAATVRLCADADGDPGTTGDQVVFYAGVDANGAQQDVTATLAPPLTPGAYTVFLEVDDGVNAIFRIALPRPLVIYPALAGVAPPRSNRYGVAGDFAVFSRGEAEDGTGPLNGDGQSDDGVMVLYNATTHTVVQPNPSVSMDVTGVAGGRARPVRGQFGTLAWLTLEVDEGRNLNGLNLQNPIPPLGGPDIDLIDAMVSYVVPVASTTPVTNTYGGVGAILGMADDLILVRYQEAGEGAAGTVLNGDFDTADAFFGYVDPAAPGPPFEFNQVVLHNLFLGSAAGTNLRHAGVVNTGWLATEAGGPALLDPNLDLDQGDTFLALGSLQLPGGTGAAGLFAGLAGVQIAPPVQGPTPVDAGSGFDVTLDGHAGYYIDELADNLAPGFAVGNDRNGDGVIGRVPAFYHSATLTETMPAGVAGLVNAAPGSPLLYDGTRMFFTAMEAPRIDPMPGTNGDGDGGADLQVLYWCDHTAPIPVPAFPVGVALGGGLTLTGLSLDQGGSMVKLAPGWFALVVNELANGVQDINGSGFPDMAYLLLETGAPVPLVHNPKLVPSAAGTFPLTGIWGEDPVLIEQGVVLRVSEAAHNRDLDGDGNAGEILMAYLGFKTPSEALFFDFGGDHCAVARGRIAVTADEAFTGEDYDGNGSTTDTVFRVLDFRGRVLERGLPCSRLSVPVTELGTLWAYLRDEATENRNLNGDGDTTDLILGLWIP